MVITALSPVVSFGYWTLYNICVHLLIHTVCIYILCHRIKLPWKDNWWNCITSPRCPFPSTILESQYLTATMLQVECRSQSLWRVCHLLDGDNQVCATEIKSSFLKGADIWEEIWVWSDSNCYLLLWLQFCFDFTEHSESLGSVCFLSGEMDWLTDSLLFPLHLSKTYRGRKIF